MRTVGLGTLFVICSFAVACTATGSETVIGGGPAPSATNPFEQPSAPSESSGATNTKKPSTQAEYEALFGPPVSTKATPNSLTGTWAGEDSGGYDTRFKFMSDAVVVAKKCSSSGASGSTIGVTVTSVVSSSSVKTLESKSASGLCSINIRPTELTPCTASKYENCFELQGTTLDIKSTVIGYVELTKLSDE